MMKKQMRQEEGENKVIYYDAKAAAWKSKSLDNPNKSKVVFYDAKGGRKVFFNWFVAVTLITLIVVYYVFFQSILATATISFKPLVNQDKKIVSIDEKLSDEQLLQMQKKLKNQDSNNSNSQFGLNPSQSSGINNSQNKESYGFYVNWNENSFTSLKDNIGSLTTLVPEWFHLNKDLTFSSEIKPDVTQLAKDHNVKIMPLINNFTKEGANTEAIKNLLHASPNDQTKFINELEKQIESNHFAGINIDFNSFPEQDRDNFTSFVKELAAVFHQHQLLVSVDVPADDNTNTFDYSALSKEVDRMIVMMYDEHYESGNPGPIASNKWFEDTLNHLDIPSDKLIVAFGNYGYDWTVDSEKLTKNGNNAGSLTFTDIMKMAHNSNLKIQWDKISGNPYFRYKDGENDHIVWFLDGVTLYNQMKIASKYDAKGFAFWRMGGEDPSVWKTLDTKKPTDINAIHKINGINQVDYSGKGEILRVMNTGKDGSRDFKVEKDNMLTDEEYQTYPLPYQVQRYGQPNGKQVVLTFDDGPDSAYTPKILDILKQNNVKADFFVVGRNAGLHTNLVKRIYDEGHEIGNNTFTHTNVADASPLRTKLELNTTQRLIQEVTGHSTVLFRPTFSAGSEPDLPSEMLPIIRAQEMNYTMVGEKVDPGDWKESSTSELVKRVLTPIYNGDGHVILLHDSGGDRSHTVEALPLIIQDLKKNGYSFVTISDLMGQNRNDVMPSVHLTDKAYLWYDWAVFSGIEKFNNTLTVIFYLTIVLGILRFVFLIIYAYKEKRRIKSRVFTNSSYKPSVSVLIAAYNEEEVITKTIESILESDYPNFEILIVDDGSKDNTSKVIQDAFRSNDKIRLVRKDNGGKASAMNLGFQIAKGEIIVSLDADTIIASDAISLLVRHFEDDRVAAVSGNVKVGNTNNLLTKWQSVEYITGFNLERRAFDELNAITVVPGAIGAWHKNRVKKVGYFSEDTLAEDADLTLTLLRQGYKIEYEEKALAYTESPETVKSFLKQRYRWTFGTLQCVWKHKKALFNRKQKSLGFIALPNMLFQYFFQLVSPFTDILMVMGIFSPHPLRVIEFYFAFLIIDLVASVFAFRLEKESLKPLLWFIIQRLVYRQFMTYVVFKSVFASIRGIAVGWNKFKRMGTVTKSLGRNNEVS